MEHGAASSPGDGLEKAWRWPGTASETRKSIFLQIAVWGSLGQIEKNPLEQHRSSHGLTMDYGPAMEQPWCNPWRVMKATLGPTPLPASGFYLNLFELNLSTLCANEHALDRFVGQK